MGAEQPTRLKLTRYKTGNQLPPQGNPRESKVCGRKRRQTHPACVVIFWLLQSFWLQPIFAKPPTANLSQQDLTARECLAAARSKRHAQNWPEAIAYYQQLDAEFGGPHTRDRQQATYQFELLDCLLKNNNYAESIPLIEKLHKNYPLPMPLRCRLLLIKGECEYRVKKYSSARKSLSELLSNSQLENPANEQLNARAFILIAESFLAENLNNEALEYLSRNAPTKPALQSMVAALKATACLRLNLPDKASETLAACSATMAACYLGASRDSLLLQAAVKFCQTDQPERALHCILRTTNPTHSIQALHARLLETDTQILDAKKRGNIKTADELTKFQVRLRNEIHVASEQKSLLANAVQMTAQALASRNSTREAFILLKYFVALPLSHPSPVILAQQKMLLDCALRMERWDESITIAEKLETEFEDTKQQLETALLKGIAISKTNTPANNQMTLC